VGLGGTDNGSLLLAGSHSVGLIPCRTRRCSEREPADSLRDKFNVTGGWLPSLTFALHA